MRDVDELYNTLFATSLKAFSVFTVMYTTYCIIVLQV